MTNQSGILGDVCLQAVEVRHRGWVRSELPVENTHATGLRFTPTCLSCGAPQEPKQEQPAAG